MRFASTESGQVNRENGVDKFAEFVLKVGLTLRGGGGIRPLASFMGPRKRGCGVGQTSVWPWRAGYHEAS